MKYLTRWPVSAVLMGEKWADGQVVTEWAGRQIGGWVTRHVNEWIDNVTGRGGRWSDG